MSQSDGLVHHLSPPDAKIALFRSLFRGRDDVYPRRFENRRTGKSGYAPACGNEWVLGLCEKPRIKCASCSNQHFLPVTDAVIRWHLSGHDDSGRDFVMGVYPLLRDETCYFLAADLDKAQWEEDAQAILGTCRQLDLAARGSYTLIRRRAALDRDFIPVPGRRSSVEGAAITADGGS